MFLTMLKIVQNKRQTIKLAVSFPCSALSIIPINLLALFCWQSIRFFRSFYSNLNSFCCKHGESDISPRY